VNKKIVNYGIIHLPQLTRFPKFISELYSPVSGIVVEKNDALEKAPALINSSAHVDGWLFKVKLTNKSELETLMNEGAYTEYLKSQEEH
jgi:glycine cleavage system H protein